MLSRSLPGRVVSGGQTGVDRAALDWAIDHGILHGGWCPEGRLAEDGTIPSRYHLEELPGARYAARTRQNVVDSDATLILNVGLLEGCTERTLQIARRLDWPCLVIDLDAHPAQVAASEVRAFMATRRHCTLNVAGPRESKRPGVGAMARSVLEAWGKL